MNMKTENEIVNEMVEGILRVAKENGLQMELLQQSHGTGMIRLAAVFTVSGGNLADDFLKPLKEYSKKE
jgi:hypothetical protein